jgi:hypothetical protein
VTIDPTIVIAAIGALVTALGTAARMIYLDLRRDRDFWRKTALASLGHVDKALEVAANGHSRDA